MYVTIKPCLYVLWDVNHASMWTVNQSLANFALFVYKHILPILTSHGVFPVDLLQKEFHKRMAFLPHHFSFGGSKHGWQAEKFFYWKQKVLVSDNCLVTSSVTMEMIDSRAILLDGLLFVLFLGDLMDGIQVCIVQSYIRLATVCTTSHDAYTEISACVCALFFFFFAHLPNAPIASSLSASWTL